MTDLWKFSQGGEGEDQEQQEFGGLSVSQFFCKKRPSPDSQQYPFFEPFIVPHGLVYLPECTMNENNDYNEESEEEDDITMCTNFDKLFYLAATNLGKSKSNSKSEKSKTRKKITR
jgi:hypothetical protein